MTATATLETPTESTLDGNIDACNSLLRGELSAIETYQQAIEKFEDEPETAKLRMIQAEHKRSAHELREQILKMGGAPEIESGSWGTLTQAVQSTANFFGEESALRSLAQGEKIGCTAYESALKDDSLLPETKLAIRDRLLPRTMSHVESLDAIQESL